MRSGQARLEVQVDIFDKQAQKALVLPGLKPPDLVAAILQEFRELDYLGESPAAYRLLRGDGSPLEEMLPLGEQLHPGERLRLAEVECPLPEGTHRPSRAIYLREQRTGAVFRLPWQPAIVGRMSEHQPHNAWVAVDLRSYPTGLRVSRRHVKVSEAGGSFYVEALSHNPTSLVQEGGREQVLEPSHRYSLESGDVIRLDRSDIHLKFIVREPMNTAQTALGVATFEGMDPA